MLKRWILLIALLLGSALSFAAPEELEEDDLPPPPPPPRGKAMRGDKGVDKNFWRAYNEMTAEERQEMRKLQLKDMAEFKKQMELRVENIRRRDEEHTRKIKELTTAYQTSEADRKLELKAELRTIIAEGYMARLRNTRNHLEEMRRRARLLDKELREREKNADARIDDLTEKLLKSDPKPGARRKNRKP